MACYRCIVVITPEREPPREPVGVCRRCGAMACERDGALDQLYPKFVCGMCETSRLSSSGGFPPPDPPGPRGGGGGGPGDPTPAPTPVDSGGGGAVYADSAEFEQRMSRIANESHAHREVWKEDIERTLVDLRELGADEKARVLLARHLGDELDPRGVRKTMLLLSGQLEAASERGALKPDLLADAFGVAAWVIGAEPGEEPSVTQLAHLSDPRLRVALGYSMIRATTP